MSRTKSSSTSPSSATQHPPRLRLKGRFEVFYPEAGETVAVLDDDSERRRVRSTRALSALCVHGRADLGDYFVERQAASRCHSVRRATWRSRSPLGRGRTPGHRGPCDHRDSRSSPCPPGSTGPPPGWAPAACLPGPSVGGELAHRNTFRPIGQVHASVLLEAAVSPSLSRRQVRGASANQNQGQIRGRRSRRIQDIRRRAR